MQTVFVAGATGYLGRHLVEDYVQRGWQVRALVRSAVRASEQGLKAQQLIQAEATNPATLKDVMDGVDLVVSSLGITRQRDGLSYWDVDYQANRNLLREAEHAGAKRFAYVHVLGAKCMAHVPLIAAKQAFVDALRASDMASTIIAPSGYFSDMGEVFASAQAGRAWVFGDGSKRLNPIHGADLAKATAEAIARGDTWLDIGGPETFTQTELAQAAFVALGKPAKISHLPDWLRKAALAILPRITPLHIHGPAQFLLTALGQDMVGEAHGTHHLSDHFASLAKAQPQKAGRQASQTLGAKAQ